jgi:hypothetical protein
MRRGAALAVLAAAFALGAAGCGGSGGGDPVRTTVTRYLDALGHGDAAGICAAVSPKTREKEAEFGADRLRIKPASCRATIDRLMASVAGPRLRGLGKARIVSVVRHGDRAEVRIDGFDRPTDVVREGRSWLIDAAPTGEKD